MSETFHEQVTRILLAALERTATQRAAYLDAACGDNTELRTEVEALLAAEDRPVGFLDAPDGSGIAGAALDVPRGRLIGQRIGSFLIEREIAAGGMGVVYEALQDQPRRKVALKLMRSGTASRSSLRRFEFEAELLGRLRHPGIAQVYDAGVHDDGAGGAPYFAMEFIPDALPITEYARRHRLTGNQRLEQFARLCDAVHHGHQHGVIHRDLKPDNVLVDPTGQPRVIDFGVARVADADLQLTSMQTNVGQLIGTVPYMSPEQVAGDPAELDIRSDVYALGVMLYELMIGRLPIDVRQCTLPEAVTQIRERDPQRLGSIDRSLRGDVETIASKALEKDKTRRYASAAELAGDIRHYLADEPIVARPPTTMYQIRKFARRHRALVAGASLAIVALLVGSIVSVSQAVSATRARDLARQQREASRQQAYLAGIAAATAGLENHDVGLARRSLERAPRELRGWEWQHLLARLDQSLVTIPAGATDMTRFLGNDLVAFEHQTRVWRRWSARTGQRKPDLSPAELRRLDPSFGTFSASHGATYALQTDAVTVYGPTLESPQEHRLDDLQIPAQYNLRAELSPDGNTLLLNTLGSAWVVNLQTGTWHHRRLDVGGEGTGPAAINDRGQAVFGTGAAGTPGIWDTQAGTWTPLAGRPVSASAVRFHPDGRRVVGAMSDATVRIWDAGTGELLRTGYGHRNLVTDVAVSPEGDWIASVSRDRTLRLWHGETMRPLAALHGHASEIETVCFSPDGESLVTVGSSADGTIRVWDLASSGDPTVLRGHSNFVYPVAFSPDGARIASGGWDGTIRLWSANRMQSVDPVMQHGATIYGLAFNPRGDTLASVDADRVVRLWDPRSGRTRLQMNPARYRQQFDEEMKVSPRLTWHPDSVHLLIMNDQFDDTIVVWNTATDELARRPATALREWDRGQVSPDGRLAVVRSAAGRHLIQTSDLQRVLDQPIGFPYRFAPAPSKLFACTDPAEPMMVHVWDTQTRQRVGTLRGHTGRRVHDVLFAPDAARILTAGDDNVIRIWDARTLEELMQLRGHTSYIWSLAFSPDGTQLISGSGDHTVRIWDSLPLNQRRDQARPQPVSP